MRHVLLPCLVGAAVTAQAGAAEAPQVPEKLAAIVAKTQSFGLGRYPISFWSYTNLKEHGRYMDEAEVEEWADAGFTVPQSPSFDANDPAQKAHIQRLLNWARERQMKLILCDPRCRAQPGPNGDWSQMPPDYADGIRAAVKDFGSHPATFGFHVGDEPDAAMKETFFRCYRVQKEVAPHLFPFANLLPWWPGAEERAGTDTWPNYLDEYVRDSNADLISYDYYGQMVPGEDGWNGYYENLRLYREAMWRNGVPFWNTLLSVGHFRYRCPNYDEIRWQFNTTVASGAHGVLWFFYYMRQPHANYRLSPVDEHWDRTQTYYDIRRVQKSFHRFYGDLFTRLVSTRVTFHPKAYGNGEVFKPNGIVSQILAPEGHPVLLGEFVDLQGRRYVMLVNNSMTESAKIGLTFPGQDVKVFSWNWSGAEYEGDAYCADGQSRDEKGLTIHHWLAPGQEAVYRVQSQSAAREPLP
ncbi:MAG: hypothetical protein GX774_16420 [Armatimonadetes bacterium]|nr:hypothetical protein [Armatimonadota bacterium]